MKENISDVVVYTDGACSGNPGPGGWGSVLLFNGHRRELSGGASETTNNRMELLAVIESLRNLKEPCVVMLFTDSKYICNAINKGWLQKWKLKNWMRTQHEEVRNPDMWQNLDQLINKHDVNFTWVKAHSTNELNNRADEIAVKASKNTVNMQIDVFFEKDAGLSFG